MATQTSVLTQLSRDLASAVASAGRSVVRVDDGTRLTACGTIWSPDGLIVATSHGVEQDDDLKIVLFDGTELSGSVAGRDQDSDIALIRAQGSGLPAVNVARRAPEPGELVLAVARPGHSGLQATHGVVGGLSSVGPKDAGHAVLSTDAAMYPGFSGGALMSSEGEFLGLLNLGYGRGRGVAVGAKLVESVVEALASNGVMRRGYLGIASQPVRLGRHGEGGAEFGLLISSVESDSAAEKAGLLLGDVILAVDGQTLSDPSDLRGLLRGRKVGDGVTLTILRGGQSSQIQAVLGSRE